MLTEDQRSQYRRYKRDTSVFLSWLSVTSKQCGYKLPSHASPTRSRPQNQTLKISLKHVSGMAKSIVERGAASLQIPASIATIARRAVATRKSFSREMQEKGLLASNRSSDSSHRHFVNVLGHTLDTLVANLAPPQTQTTADESTTGPAVALLSNMFQSLQVEDVEEDDEEDDTSAPLSHAPANAPKQEAEQIFEVMDESEQQLERLVILHDYLKELYEVGEYVSQQWQKYRDSEIGLETASILTTAAVALAAEKEKHVAETLCIAENQLWEKVKANRPAGQKPIRAEAKDSTEFFGFLYFIEMIMATFWQNHDPRRTIAPDIPTIKASFTEFGRAPEDPSLPMFDDTLLLEQTDVLLSQTLTHAVFTTAHVANCSKDTSCSGSEKVNKKEVRDDPRTELPSYYRYSQAVDVLTWHLAQPFIDHPGAGLCGTICGLFVGSLIVRIETILSSSPTKAFEELSEYETKLRARLKATNPSKRRGNLAEIKALDDAALMQPQALARMSLGAKNTAIKLMEGGKRPQKLDDNGDGDGVIAASLNADFLAKHNPILCGMKLLGFKHGVEAAGITIANTHLSVLEVATLVNVLRQTSLLRIQWPDLDRALKLQMSNLFLGTVPVSPETAHKVYMLRFGLHLAQYDDTAREPLAGVNLHRPGHAYTSRVRPDSLKVTEASSIFSKLYDNDETLLRTVYALKAEADKSRDKITANDPPTSTKTKAKANARKTTKDGELATDAASIQLVDTEIFVPDAWKELIQISSPAWRDELNKVGSRAMRTLDPVMQSVVDFFHQPFMLMVEMTVVQMAKQSGLPYHFLPEHWESCRYAVLVRRWIERNIGVE